MKNLGLLKYEDVKAALPAGRSHLLLGNGFSIACDDRFNYGSLFEYAQQKGLSGRVLDVFERLGTNNFEGVMRLLEDAHWMVCLYKLWKPAQAKKSEMLTDLESVKSALVGALANTHPIHTHEIAEGQKDCCGNFLEPYHNIFSTNYDLLLYWVEMHAHGKLQGRDGFRTDVDKPDAKYVVFTERVGDQKGIFFLHGALHLFVVNGQVRKHTWSRTKETLIQSIRASLDEGQYPLFVAEGLPEKKLEQIQRSGYLSYCLSKLERIDNSLVVFGLSFGESDGHIADVLAQNRKLKTLYVGLYGDPESEANLGVRKNVAAMIQRRTSLIVAKRAQNPLEVKFYDVSTAPVWAPI